MSHSGVQESVDVVDSVRIRRALISVFDKSGLLALAKTLTEHEVELFSTGGTERYLREHGFDVHSVTDLTKFPEMLDGRIKTLHPMVHGGLLYRRDLASHRAQISEHGIPPIDLLVVNLYPFEETVAKPGATRAEIVEQIDIGGPAMLRSAAKNFNGVALLTSPEQYTNFIAELDASAGGTTLSTRFALAAEAFANVARYDAAISNYFGQLGIAGTEEMQPHLDLSLDRVQPLRYGENPHQSAALYGEDFAKIFQQLWGKELSYNNILDLSASTLLIAEFMSSPIATVAIIKHMNPCGVAQGSDVLDAFDRAFRADPESPFGGIVVMNRPLTALLAERLNGFFSEVIVAPSFESDALTILQKKKDRRLVRFSPEAVQASPGRSLELRSVLGGVLVQQTDVPLLGSGPITSVTKRPVSDAEMEGLLFAWKCVKHIKSNAIVYCGLEDGFARTLGIGAGQTSRVESSRLAVKRAAQFGHSLAGSFVASDAFFPFADGLTEAIVAGAIAVIQPGGSIRDTEVIAEAEKHGISMVLTGMRHFRH